jgi:uncharacterized membrane-anchored protein
MLSKVPEVTVWFWVIKILCTTVGESFADWINATLGVGLTMTALIFTVVLAAVLGWQLRFHRCVPFVYWLVVVVFSVTGTLYTDILTDKLGVPLAVSTSVFAAALTIVFSVWYTRERTLSIHSIVTLPRESFYWQAVLVTFALVGWRAAARTCPRGGRSEHDARDYLNHRWTGNHAFPASRDREVTHVRPRYARKGAGWRADQRDCPNHGS